MFPSSPSDDSTFFALSLSLGLLNGNFFLLIDCFMSTQINSRLICLFIFDVVRRTIKTKGLLNPYEFGLTELITLFIGMPLFSLLNIYWSGLAKCYEWCVWLSLERLDSPDASSKIVWRIFTSRFVYFIEKLNLSIRGFGWQLVAFQAKPNQTKLSSVQNSQCKFIVNGSHA